MSELVRILEPQAEAAETTALANLASYAAQAEGAYAPNTERAIRADTAVFTTWCSEHGLAAMPALASTIATYVDAMAELKAPATIRRYVGSITHMHRAARIEPNPAADSSVRLALRRLHRAHGRAQAQVTPLNRKLLEKLLEAGGTRLRELRNRAILAVAYDTLCRRSELVALNEGIASDVMQTTR